MTSFSRVVPLAAGGASVTSQIAWLGISATELACFVGFWGLQVKLLSGPSGRFHARRAALALPAPAPIDTLHCLCTSTQCHAEPLWSRLLRVCGTRTDCLILHLAGAFPITHKHRWPTSHTNLILPAQVAIITKGMESVRFVEKYAAPILIALSTALLIWARRAAGGFGPMLSAKSQFAAGMAKEGQFWQAFLPAVTANIGYWATLSLNISDFTR